MGLHLYSERVHGSQEKEEEGKEEKERIRPACLPDTHLLGPGSSDAQGVADHPSRRDGGAQRGHDSALDHAHQCKNRTGSQGHLEAPPGVDH